jgi:hypothetical protein
LQKIAVKKWFVVIGANYLVKRGKKTGNLFYQVAGYKNILKVF